MGMLAFGCIGIGALPVFVMPAIDRVVQTWIALDPPPPALGELVPWIPLMGMSAALAVAVLATALLIRHRSRSAAAPVVTWDCGYARPGPTMAYTASSFAQILVGLHGWLLRPRASRAVSDALFPPARTFHSEVPEPVMEGVLTPLWARFRRVLVPFRALQHGRIQQYVLYILLTLTLLIASSFPIDKILARLLRW
jgi:hypothetical protein